MASSPAASPSLDAYQLRLPTFEGPLDVLLRLIEREQLSVSDVSLLAVLDQFMAFMRELDSPSPDVVAEFAAVAGRLSLLKSRALLPRPGRPIEEPDESDLVRQLEEYRALKAAAGMLAERQSAGAGGFASGEAIARPAPAPPRFTPQPPITISRAVTRWLTRLPRKPVPISPIRVVTLREMISHIFTALDRDRVVTFQSVRAASGSRQDVAVAFLAVLTLVRRHAIHATQDTLFGAITLSRANRATGPDSRSEAIHDDEEDGPEQLLA